MDDEFAVTDEGEDDHFEQLPIVSRSNHQYLRRVGVRIHVYDHQGVLDGVKYFTERNTVSGG